MTAQEIIQNEFILTYEAMWEHGNDDYLDELSHSGDFDKSINYVILAQDDISIETRETSYTTYKSDRKSIESVIDGLLDRFALESKSGIDDTTISTEGILPVRKIGLKVSNLIRQDNKNFRLYRKTLLDYID